MIEDASLSDIQRKFPKYLSKNSTFSTSFYSILFTAFDLTWIAKVIMASLITIIINLAQIEQGLERFLSCAERVK